MNKLQKKKLEDIILSIAPEKWEGVIAIAGSQLQTTYKSRKIVLFNANSAPNLPWFTIDGMMFNSNVAAEVSNKILSYQFHIAQKQLQEKEQEILTAFGIE